MWALLSSHGGVEEQSLGLERGSWRGRFVVWSGVGGVLIWLCLLSSHCDVQKAASGCRKGIVEDWPTRT